jgi:DNA processing protein
MNGDELPWLIALTQVPHIGPVHARQLLQCKGSAREIFRSSRRELECMPGIGTVRAQSILQWKDFSQAEKEIRFMEKFRIRALVLGQPDYPGRLSHCYDAPLLLYYRGSASLNPLKTISIIGTRTPTEYGKDRVRDLLISLAPYEPIVFSGLAYGIDTLAHKYSLKQGLETVGVLAHGLDRIYPGANKSLAREMMEQGGLLTDFPSGTNPDAVNFPRRNRIVAGMSDAVIVVETGIKGGSMITASLAGGYNREVFALPGRVTDPKSEGCLVLIRQHQAQLLQDPVQVAESLNWLMPGRETIRQQAIADFQLSAPEQTVWDCIRQKSPRSLDELLHHTGIPAGEMAGILLSLEMYQLIAPLPGMRYRLLV